MNDLSVKNLGSIDLSSIEEVVWSLHLNGVEIRADELRKVRVITVTSKKPLCLVSLEEINGEYDYGDTSSYIESPSIDMPKLQKHFGKMTLASTQVSLT